MALPPGDADSAGEDQTLENAGSLSRARGRQPEAQEAAVPAADELAQEVPRTSLLDRVEQQLKGAPHVSRLFLGFTVADDREAQLRVERAFGQWAAKEGSGELTGLLFFLGQNAVHLLEGPTGLLFDALAFSRSISSEPKPPPVPEVGEEAPNSPALTGPVRVLHFTELHGVRLSTSWCACSGSGRLQQPGAPLELEEGNAAEACFAAYRKLCLACARVTDALGHGEEATSANYLEHRELLPIADDVAVLLSKGAADQFFSCAEFEEVFVEPFHLVLHSELLWPMPPAMTY